MKYLGGKSTAIHCWYHTVPQNTYSVYLGHFSSLFFAKLRALDDLKTASNIEETTQAITEISSSVFYEKKHLQ